MRAALLAGELPWPCACPSATLPAISLSHRLSDFKKNHHSRLTPEMEACVRRRWAPAFRAFGYQ